MDSEPFDRFWALSLSKRRNPPNLLRGFADLLLGQDKPDRSHIGQAKGLTEPNHKKQTAASE